MKGLYRGKNVFVFFPLFNKIRCLAKGYFGIWKGVQSTRVYDREEIATSSS